MPETHRPQSEPPPVVDDLSIGPFRTAEAEPMAIEDIRDALVVRENGTFLLTDKYGNVPAGNESGFGLYRGDTRFLSTYEFVCTNAPPVLLLSEAGLGYACEQVLTNPRMTSSDGHELPRETIELRRRRTIDIELHETLQITNFNAVPVTLEYRYRFDADFADIFEVRGQKRRHSGLRLPAVATENGFCLAYHTLDGRELRTHVSFEQQPARIQDRVAVFRLALGPRETQALSLHVRTEDLARAPEPDPPAPYLRPRVALAEQYRRWKDACTRFFTGNEIFNAVLDQSLHDLRMLWNFDGDGEDGYLSAGTPWFDTLFGRDSLITSLELLAFNPRLARSTLLRLAEHQGQVNDEWRDEEPGKILHELRTGELSRLGEIPFARYYGSIDSTPLFLLLAAEYWRWTADTALLQRLKPNLRAALDWVWRSGDRDGDGYIEYERHSENGLLNQGWKDSGDAIVHSDGRLARPPIALVEVQAYLYAALLGLAPAAEALRDSRWAGELRRAAFALRARFNRDFWLEDEGCYALALDGEKQPVRSIASNAGHALFAGIATPPRAAAVAERLLQREMFSGWGVRTLSAASARFNPMGYHLGSIWPHDNALIALGLKRYGQETALSALATAIYDTARTMDHFRLPELFCGLPRSPEGQPVPYPVACRPQAWAAGAVPAILTALLGLSPDAQRSELLIVQPRLPYWLNSVQVRGLRVGSGSVDLLFELKQRRTQVTVLNVSGALRVTVVPRWPRNEPASPGRAENDTPKGRRRD
ncbi:MAG TPA: glycogen debranching N-terminal domain-containing protein [Dehalococcoidia bacterium]|nr:glycogen debranching N-terminal domain-containing protein [Dehalococcoidia bacterium]